MDALCKELFAPLPTPEDTGPGRRFVELSRIPELARAGHGGRALVFLREDDGRLLVAVANVNAKGRITRFGSVVRLDGPAGLDEIATAARKARRAAA